MLINFFRLSDTVLILIAIVIGLGFTLFMIGLVSFLLWRNNKNRKIWQELSRTLKLHMPNPKQLKLEGVYNDCHTVLSVGARRRIGEDRTRDFFTYCQTDFPNSLRLLLNIDSRKGILTKVFNSKPMSLGQKNFDERFNAHSYDQKTLRNFLLTEFPSDRTENLAGDLMLASKNTEIIKITDSGIYIENSEQIGDEKRLREMLEITTNLSKRFFELRNKLPRAKWEMQLNENWKYLASENDLSFDPVHMSIKGVHKGFPVSIALKTAKDKWLTEISIKFPKSLMTGLKIIPENSLHKAFTWLGAQDIEAGIKAFDDAFIVKAKNIAVAKHMLQPDFCNRLVALSRKSSDFLIDDESMSVTYNSILGDARILKSYLEGMISTSTLLLK